MVPPDPVIAGGGFLCRNPSFSFNYSVSEQFIIIVGDPPLPFPGGAHVSRSENPQVRSPKVPDAAKGSPDLVA